MNTKNITDCRKRGKIANNKRVDRNTNRSVIAVV